MNKNLAIGAGIVLVSSPLLWFFVVAPEPEAVTYPPAELLADGKGHYDREEYEMALEALRQVPDGEAETARARYYEGSSYIMLKDYEAAVASLESALALEPRNTGVLYALGVAYFKLGNLAVSKGYFGAVLEINPNDERAKGLMDIMAKLERELSVPAESE